MSHVYLYCIVTAVSSGSFIPVFRSSGNADTHTQIAIWSHEPHFIFQNKKIS
jgi:hypothetical protein